ncbi:hypothetical protein BDU57DRAFT_431442, partial [Ampelomyces quisqualis]
MSARRSSRAKPPVKYTSDPEGSDFSNNKARKTKTPRKKRAQPDEEDDPAAAAASPPKRAKKTTDKPSPSPQKTTWAAFLTAHDVHGAQLSNEPARQASITQTASMQKYALQKKDLAVLRHFAKKNPNPVFRNTLKLYVEDQVRVLGWRKLGVLDGAEDDADAVARGERIWRQDDDKNDLRKNTLSKPRTHKQTWTAYVEKHAVAAQDGLDAEPEESINQSDCKAKYSLLPGDLAVLPYFPKQNQKYGNTTKLFSESEVQALAYRKAAVLGGVEDGDEVGLLEKGKELFEEK